jgi:hypothetical protein
VLTIRRSKADREGAGATVAVPFEAEEATGPVGALRRWLAAAAIGEGRASPAEIVASRAAVAGLEGDFAGHSLRDGGRAGRSLGGYDRASRAPSLFAGTGVPSST